MDHFLVEAHPGTSRYPKARGLAARSMEIFRRCGLEEDIRQAGLPADQVFFYRGRTLTDPDFERTGPVGRLPGEARTPSPGLICSQDALEPVLLRHARKRAPHRIRFACYLVSFTDHGDSVRAVIDDRLSRTRHTCVPSGWWAVTEPPARFAGTASNPQISTVDDQ